ncbi:MAG: hypothetical protein OEX19_03180 [Gammaproteobacteria bacterium]|nr:hypothetical protein [Gammaproteobacteria bacterium]
MENYIIASCDDIYYHQHGREFIGSCLKNDNNCHIHVINPSSNTTNELNNYQEKHDQKFLFSTEDLDINDLGYDPKIAYAISRFFVVNAIRERCIANQHETPAYLILDVDCIVRKKITFPKNDVGLFLRPQESDAMKTAAGIVYINNTTNAHNFLQSAVNVMQQIKKQWYIDQWALWLAYNHHKEIDYIQFTQKFMNWDFDDPDAPIWTGKGPRKYNDQTYLAEKNKYA